MTLTRSPTGNDQKRDQQNVQNANNNPNGNQNNGAAGTNQLDPNSTIQFVEESLIDFPDPIVPRSTMHVQRENVDTNSQNNNHNENVDNNHNNLVANTSNAANKQPRINPSPRPCTSSQIPIIEKPCEVCYQNAEKNYLLCTGCNKKSHPWCLMLEEIESKDIFTNSYICFRCDSINKRLTASKNFVQASNHKINASPFLGHELNQGKSAEKAVSVESMIPSPLDNNHNAERNPNTFTNLSLLNGSTEVFLYKMQMRKLPEVHDESASWSVFYSSFIETKDLYSDYENITRIQSAIKHEKIKRIGGSGLFDLKTYAQTIEYINKRLKNNLNFLLNEAQHLESHPRIKPDNKQKLVEYIDKIRNFVVRSISYKDVSMLTNKRFIATVADVIPTYLRNKWEAHQAILEEMGQSPSLQHMMQILERELPRIEASIRNDTLRNSNKRFDSKSAGDKEPHSDRFHKHRVNNVTENSHPYNRSKNKTFGSKFANQPVSKTFTCWLHNTNEHTAYKCNVLWELDGKSVSDLARSHNICTFCGQPMSPDHKPCKNCNNLKCKMNGCSFKHHELFCFKRKGRKSGANKEGNSKSHEHKVFTNRNRNEVSHEKPSSDNASNEAQSVENMLAQLNSHNLYTNLPSNVSHVHNNNNKHVAMSINALDSCHKNKDSQPSLLGVLVVLLENKKEVALLIDSGSTTSLIEESIANELQARGPLDPLTLSWSGNFERTDNLSRIIKLKGSRIGHVTPQYNLYFRTVRDLKVCSQKFNAKQFIEMHPKFKFLNLNDYSRIDGIIGVDNLIAFRQKFLVESVNNEGIEYHGVRTALGDYVYGTERPLYKVFAELHDRKISLPSQSINSHFSLTKEEQQELMDMEKEVMGLDYYSEKDDDITIVEEKRIYDLLDANCKKVDNENNYVAPLLWKEEKFELPTAESFKMSLRRYLIVEKQALKLGKFQECVDQIQNLLDKNYAQEMTTEEIKENHEKAYYNPVFFIYPPNKRTRLIWDLAAKVNGKSLNDRLLTGPNLYNGLLDIIFRMRENEHFVKGDIGEMFHQIKVDQDDSHALRFLFRMSPSDKIRVFKMNVLPFGAKCSPFLSQYVKNKVANDYLHQFPQAADTILKNSYVDDIIKSHNDPHTLARIALDMRKVLEHAGFNLLKLHSNSDQVLSEIKSGLNEKELCQEKLFSDETEEKLLGYNINFETDKIYLAINPAKWNNSLINAENLPTKRQLLQILMSIFDPLGCFQFITSKLKIVYHLTCKEQADWDQIIHEKHREVWQKSLLWLEKATSVGIPRNYCDNTQEVCKTQLWNFGDAGDEMMCGVCYIRYLNAKNEQINVRMIYAKTFTIPYKSDFTTPQKELDIAAKIVDMSKRIIDSQCIKFDEVYYGSDNKAVIDWIRLGARKATLFMKNRLTKISSFTTPSQWKQIPSEIMPADFGTKLTSMVDVQYDNNWFIPILFRMQECNWPECVTNFVPQVVNFHDSIENVTDVADTHVLDASRYSKLHKLISVGMLGLKWRQIVDCSNLKKKIDNLECYLSKNKHDRGKRLELKECQEMYRQKSLEKDDKTHNYGKVEKIAIKLAQSQSYEKEIALLNEEDTLPPGNRIFKLKPFIDKEGLLRARSRIPLNEKNLTEFGYDTIFPIILHKDHEFTRLIILKFHENNKHFLNSTLVANLMRRFFIQHIKWTVKRIIKTYCYHCIRHKASPQTPLMGALPDSRLAYHLPPFSFAMVDLAGPVIVKNYRNRDIKRYIFVYGCLTTRAIHLELLENLTSDATLMALQNVFNLRGCAKKIYSDLGSSFVGAWSILKSCQTEWNDKLLKKGVIIEPIEWEFGPAKAPHFQGAIERMVGLTKTALKNMITSLNKDFVKYSDFQLHSILYEITALLNNRPLTTVDTNEEGVEILTPNCFLLGRQNIQTVPIEEHSNRRLQDRWLDIKTFTSRIWKQWLCSYIPMIRMREKWLDFKNPLKIDDVVILADPSIPNAWRLGRIIDVKAGSENQVRSATVKIGKSNVLTVPITKSSKNHILKLYRDERHSIVTRPAVALAKINV